MDRKKKTPNGKDASKRKGKPETDVVVAELAPDVYIPKVGDKAVYFKGGHVLWEEMKEESCRLNLKTFPDVAIVNITASNLLPDYSVSIAFMVPDKKIELKLDYIAKKGIDFTPFIVPHKSYQDSLSRRWKVGEICGMKFDDGIVYSGRIQEIRNDGKDWESITVHWDSDDTVTQVNIWELLRIEPPPPPPEPSKDTEKDIMEVIGDCLESPKSKPSKVPTKKEKDSDPGYTPSKEKKDTKSTTKSNLSNTIKEVQSSQPIKNDPADFSSTKPAGLKIDDPIMSIASTPNKDSKSPAYPMSGDTDTSGAKKKALLTKSPDATTPRRKDLSEPNLTPGNSEPDPINEYIDEPKVELSTPTIAKSSAVKKTKVSSTKPTPQAITSPESKSTQKTVHSCTPADDQTPIFAEPVKQKTVSDSVSIGSSKKESLKADAPVKKEDKITSKELKGTKEVKEEKDSSKERDLPDNIITPLKAKSNEAHAIASDPLEREKPEKTQSTKKNSFVIKSNKKADVEGLPTQTIVSAPTNGDIDVRMTLLDILCQGSNMSNAEIFKQNSDPESRSWMSTPSSNKDSSKKISTTPQATKLDSRQGQAVESRPTIKRPSPPQNDVTQSELESSSKPRNPSKGNGSAKLQHGLQSKELKDETITLQSNSLETNEQTVDAKITTPVIASKSISKKSPSLKKPAIGNHDNENTGTEGVKKSHGNLSAPSLVETKANSSQANIGHMSATVGDSILPTHAGAGGKQVVNNPVEKMEESDKKESPASVLKKDKSLLLKRSNTPSNKSTTKGPDNPEIAPKSDSSTTDESKHAFQSPSKDMPNFEPVNLTKVSSKSSVKRVPSETGEAQQEQSPTKKLKPLQDEALAPPPSTPSQTPRDNAIEKPTLDAAQTPKPMSNSKFKVKLKQTSTAAKVEKDVTTPKVATEEKTMVHDVVPIINNQDTKAVSSIPKAIPQQKESEPLVLNDVTERTKVNARPSGGKQLVSKSKKNTMNITIEENLSQMDTSSTTSLPTEGTRLTSPQEISRKQGTFDNLNHSPGVLPATSANLTSPVLHRKPKLRMQSLSDHSIDEDIDIERDVSLDIADKKSHTKSQTSQRLPSAIISDSPISIAPNVGIMCMPGSDESLPETPVIPRSSKSHTSSSKKISSLVRKDNVAGLEQVQEERAGQEKDKKPSMRVKLQSSKPPIPEISTLASQSNIPLPKDTDLMTPSRNPYSLIKKIATEQTKSSTVHDGDAQEVILSETERNANITPSVENTPDSRYGMQTPYQPTPQSLNRPKLLQPHSTPLIMGSKVKPPQPSRSDPQHTIILDRPDNAFTSKLKAPISKKSSKLLQGAGQTAPLTASNIMNTELIRPTINPFGIKKQVRKIPKPHPMFSFEDEDDIALDDTQLKREQIELEGFFSPGAYGRRESPMSTKHQLEYDSDDADRDGYPPEKAKKPLETPRTPIEKRVLVRQTHFCITLQPTFLIQDDLDALSCGFYITPERNHIRLDYLVFSLPEIPTFWMAKLQVLHTKYGTCKVSVSSVDMSGSLPHLSHAVERLSSLSNTDDSQIFESTPTHFLSRELLEWLPDTKNIIWDDFSLGHSTSMTNRATDGIMVSTLHLIGYNMELTIDGIISFKA